MKPSITAANQTELCEQKASQVMRWISEMEDVAKTEFAVVRLFEQGVLPEGTKGFLHILLESQFVGDRTGLELQPEKIRELLIEAFQNTAHYLLSPQSFLADFLTLDTDSINISTDVLLRLSYLVDYPYFSEWIDEWLDARCSKGNSAIPKSAFEEFLFQTDQLVTQNVSTEELATLLEPLIHFYGGDRLPDEMAWTFFEDKRLQSADSAEHTGFDASELAIALKEAKPMSEPIQSSDDFAPIPEYDSFLKELREIGVILPPPHKDHSVATEASLPPMEIFLSKKARTKLIEKIFQGNELEYNRAMDQLNTSADYKQAQLNLRTILGMYKVRAGSKSALRLEYALHLRYGIQVENILP
ncbi:MAG: hypothetical protein WCH46_08140 [bacterium]